MKRVIKGKLYDTEKATEVAEWSDGAPSDFRYIEETLYRKRTGEYFLYGYGGPMTQYSERVGNAYGYGSRIVPLAYEEACSWGEDHMGADEWQAEFGPAEDSGSNAVAHIHATVSETARQLLETECKRTGETRSAVIERLLLGLGR